MPARFTRVMLIPNELRSLRSPSFVPLIPGFVTRILRDISWLSIAFQSIPFLFQSTFSCGPKSSVNFWTSLFPEITSMCSLSSIIVSPVGIITFPSFQILEITNWHFALLRISCMLLPMIAALLTTYSVMKVLSEL